jgi:hypothetical protein
LGAFLGMILININRYCNGNKIIKLKVGPLLEARGVSQTLSIFGAIGITG